MCATCVDRVVVRAGTRVVWAIDGPHGITSGLPGRPNGRRACTVPHEPSLTRGRALGKFTSGSPGSVTRFEHVFTKAGTYPYHCRSHSGALQGVVVVVDQAKLKGMSRVLPLAPVAAVTLLLAGVASEMGVKYVLLHEGFRKSVASPQRFDTGKAAGSPLLHSP